jgi:transcriptional regulator with XRE-family HTH domain
MDVATPKGPFYKALGVKLEQARQRAAYTQEGLARAVGLSRTSITNIEKGRQPVQAHVLARLAEVLNTSIVALVPHRGDVQEPTVTTELAKYSIPTQAWAKRVIATYSEEEGYGSPKGTSKEESKRTTGRSKGKTPAGSR